MVKRDIWERGGGVGGEAETNNLLGMAMEQLLGPETPAEKHNLASLPPNLKTTLSLNPSNFPLHHLSLLSPPSFPPKTLQLFILFRPLYFVLMASLILLIVTLVNWPACQQIVVFRWPSTKQRLFGLFYVIQILPHMHLSYLKKINVAELRWSRLCHTVLLWFVDTRKWAIKSIFYVLSVVC